MSSLDWELVSSTLQHKIYLPNVATMLLQCLSQTSSAQLSSNVLKTLCVSRVYTCNLTTMLLGRSWSCDFEKFSNWLALELITLLIKIYEFQQILFCSVWGGVLVALTSKPGVPTFQERTTSYRADNHMYEKLKTNSHQWFICGTQCVKNICIMATKWLPEAIWDIRFWQNFLSSLSWVVI